MFIDRIQNILFENGYIFDEKKSKVISDPKTGVSISKDEDYIYDKLKEKYGEVKRQYKDEDRYPWECDFYIPSEDMFIEYLKHWTHGRRAYDPEDPECQKDIEWWKSKASGDPLPHLRRPWKAWTSYPVGCSRNTVRKALPQSGGSLHQACATGVSYSNGQPAACG